MEQERQGFVSQWDLSNKDEHRSLKLWERNVNSADCLGSNCSHVRLIWRATAAVDLHLKETCLCGPTPAGLPLN